MEIKVFVENLAAYNNGDSKGKWFTLPTEIEDIYKGIFDAHELDEQGNPHGDYAIHDYEAPIEISEYSSLQELNEIATFFSELKEEEVKMLTAIKNYGIIQSIVEEGKEALENIVRFDDCKDMSDVAYRIIQDRYSETTENELLLRHFDFDSYGDELDTSGTFIQVDDKLIIEYMN